LPTNTRPVCTGRTRAFFDANPITIPFAMTVFPAELYQAPRCWAERAYPDNLIYYNKV
jgi:hypothetical protein